jgi:hypothetical protein
MEKGKVLYKATDGSEILFDREEKGEIYAHVKFPDGREFPSNKLGSILARGYWEPAPGWDK